MKWSRLVAKKKVIKLGRVIKGPDRVKRVIREALRLAREEQRKSR